MDKEELKQGIKAVYSHLGFYEYFWKTQTSDKLYIGLHTRIICEEIDKAIERFNNGEGESTYLLITVPPRHGKSDIVSRYLPAHFMGMFPDKDVIIATYASSLAYDMSSDARKIVDTDEFKKVFGQELSKTSHAVDKWQMEGGKGTLTASGLLSGITGKGAHLLILDDYCADRKDAESEVVRESTWKSFTDAFMTRQAPTCICIILATPWHTDDVIGRIKKLNNPKDKEYKEDFPKFKLLSFPAENADFDYINKYGELEHIKYDYLFTDKELNGTFYKGRFTPQFYKQQRATLGDYSYQALYMCEPTTRGGNLLKVGNVVVHNSLSEFPHIRYDRIWDLAHSEKQTQKTDPDYTSGTLVGYRNVNGVWEVWIKDVARIRAEATERNNFIYAVMEKDGGAVQVGVEISIDARDTVLIMQKALRGRRRIIPIKTTGDKVTRMSYLEPCFEAGNVHILRADWNLDWLKEAKEFPSGKHDDQMDNLSAGYELRVLSPARITKQRFVGV